jgi:holo-[acyl-carrier protein] synthase
LGVGTDIVHVPRLAAVFGRHPTFATRVFTPGEIAYCESHRDSVPRFAARFAAKEAVLKALGTGLADGMNWRDVEVVNDADRRPVVRLHGRVAAIARELGVRAVLISLSHDGEYALAHAVTDPLSATVPPSAGD